MEDDQLNTQERALKMMCRIRAIRNLPDAVAFRLAALETMLDRTATDSEIALTISQCAGEKVLADNMHAGFEPKIVFDGGIM